MTTLTERQNCSIYIHIQRALVTWLGEHTDLFPLELQEEVKRIGGLLAGYDTPEMIHFVNQARQDHEDEGQIEIDDSALVSDSPYGAYVMAWAWVDRPAGVGPTNPDDFQELYSPGNVWGEWHKHDRQEWRDEVQADGTSLGYWAWAFNQFNLYDPEDDGQRDDPTAYRAKHGDYVGYDDYCLDCKAPPFKAMLPPVGTSDQEGYDEDMRISQEKPNA